MRTKLPALGLVVLVSALALAVALQNEGTPAAQPASQDGLPRPDATQLAQLTAVIEYVGGTPEPNFQGELNGIRFQRGPAAENSACAPATPPYGTASEHGSSLLRGSGLDFQAGFVPAGFGREIVHPMSSQDSGPVGVGLCGETVISLQERWTFNDAAFVIGHRATSPVAADRFLRRQLSAATIGGRPSVVVEPRFDGDEIYVFMRDGDSFWTIWSSDLPPATLRQIAEGIESLP